MITSKVFVGFTLRRHKVFI